MHHWSMHHRNAMGRLWRGSSPGLSFRDSRPPRTAATTSALRRVTQRPVWDSGRSARVKRRRHGVLEPGVERLLSSTHHFGKPKNKEKGEADEDQKRHDAPEFAHRRTVVSIRCFVNSCALANSARHLGDREIPSDPSAADAFAWRVLLAPQRGR
jgi:hypothetical protein